MPDGLQRIDVAVESGDPSPAGRCDDDRVDAADRAQPAFLFDLDGTLVDSVYQHVIAWRDALESVGIDLPVWKIHRRIGMSGGLFVNALARELDRELEPEVIAALPGLHVDAFIARFDSVRPLPGPRELLATLSAHGVGWAIATSGRERYARRSLELLGLPVDTPLVTRDQVRYAKPDPDLFGCGEPYRCGHHRQCGCRRQRVGPARRQTSGRPRRRSALRWLRARGAGLVGRLPRL